MVSQQKESLVSVWKRSLRILMGHECVEDLLYLPFWECAVNPKATILRAKRAWEKDIIAARTLSEGNPLTYLSGAADSPVIQAILSGLIKALEEQTIVLYEYLKPQFVIAYVESVRKEDVYPYQIDKLLIVLSLTETVHKRRVLSTSSGFADNEVTFLANCGSRIAQNTTNTR